MRSLPHVAIGCATVWAGTRLLGRSSMPSRADANGRAPGSLADSVDFRLVAAGSLLPDMFDRLLRSGFGVRTGNPDQHLLGHTLLFNVPVALAGVSLLRRRRDPRLAGVAAAALTHLLVDPVVRSPGTLFWPLLGFEFPAARGLNRPLTALTQLLAALAIAATGLRLIRSGRLREFISDGRL